MGILVIYICGHKYYRNLKGLIYVEPEKLGVIQTAVVTRILYIIRTSAIFIEYSIFNPNIRYGIQVSHSKHEHVMGSNNKVTVLFLLSEVFSHRFYNDLKEKTDVEIATRLCQ